ncbi:MAG: diguanylate cyclase [Deltaproteobacteria bacterium]|nr:diguanylate cyclase [Deltaproteobacteria bacterium]
MADKKRFRDQTATIEFKSVCPDQSDLKNKKAFLTVIRGGGSDLGLSTVIKDQAVLGRSPECDLPLQDLGISWEHTKVTRETSGAYILEDLGSTNGTRVNGVEVRGELALREGEKIFLGETVVRFSLADEMDLGFQNEVQQLVGTDPLTGLESKRVFDDALDYSLQLARRTEQPLAVLMMDMDGVKIINDTHGHLFGAYSIGQTGRILAKVIGNSGHVCRFGGDEFTAFLPGYDTEAALKCAEEIRLAVQNAELKKDDIPLQPTISIGIASYPKDGDHVLELVAAADGALYRAKAAGKNTVAI